MAEPCNEKPGGAMQVKVPNKKHEEKSAPRKSRWIASRFVLAAWNLYVGREKNGASA